MTRKSLPSIHKIASWWASEQGQERVNQIKRDYEVCLIDKLSNIDLDSAHCWACDKTLRSGCSNYRTKDLGLHRCHVIPDCLGGSNDPSNIILMCAECHKDNPDSTDESLFWWWFKNVESDYLQKANRLIKILPSSLNDEEADEILKEFKSDLNKTDTVPVSGRLGWGFVTASISRIVSSLEVQQSSSVGASSQDVASSLLSEFTEYEKETKASYFEAQIKSKRDRGMRLGNAKLGELKVKADGVTYIEGVESEAAKLEKVRAWRAEGLTLSQLVDRCAAEGITTRKGSSPAISTVRAWTLGVEIPQEQVEQMEAEARRKSGRPKGTPGKRAEEENRALRAVLLAYIEQGLSQAEMTRRLKAEGILNSRGKPYARQQVSRIVRRLNNLTSKSKYTGGKIPLGWRVDEDGNEIPDEDEQELISIVRGYRASRLSYSTIAEKLTSANFTSRTGSAKFSKSMAKRINDAETTAERTLRLQASFKVTHNRMSKDDD